MDDVVLLGEVSIKDIDNIGKKAAYLAELHNKKFPVPPAFLITGTITVLGAHTSFGKNSNTRAYIPTYIHTYLHT